MLLADAFPSGYHAAELAGVSTGDSEEPLIGVTCGIDAIGFQARYRENPARENPHWVIEALAKLVHPGGRLGIIGVFVDEDPAASGELERSGALAVPWGSLFKKGVIIGMGRDHDERYNGRLRDMIVTGQARPSTIVSHHIGIDEAPDAYRRFDARRDGYLKVVLRPGG